MDFGLILISIIVSMKRLLFSSAWIFMILAFIACDKTEDTSQDPAKQQVVNKSDSAFTKRITFKSLDDLDITADQYHVHKDSPTMVLCHQAGWSRGEYKEIAPRLNALGFNCIAIDQRSGGTVNGVTNETAKRAQDAGKQTTYNDAKQDITAAVNWASDFYKKSVYLWGSSYSSSLVLIIAKENDKVHTALSFSPGEYLAPTNVKSSITGLSKPTFITSSKTEAPEAKKLFDVITAADKVQFIPTGNGEHGSRALWSDKADEAEYWAAVKAFLGR